MSFLSRIAATSTRYATSLPELHLSVRLSEGVYQGCRITGIVIGSSFGAIHADRAGRSLPTSIVCSLSFGTLGLGAGSLFFAAPKSVGAVALLAGSYFGVFKKQ